MKLSTEQFAVLSDDLLPAVWLNHIDSVQNVIFENVQGKGYTITCICRHKGDVEV
jgi:hypothetical protein